MPPPKIIILAPIDTQTLHRERRNQRENNIWHRKLKLRYTDRKAHKPFTTNYKRK